MNARPEHRDFSPWQPGRLWSVWEMLVLNALEFSHVVEWLARNRESTKLSKGDLSAADRRNVRYGLNTTIARLELLDLPVSVSATRSILKVKTFADLNKGIEQLSNTIQFELENRKFYSPVRQFEKYYDNPKLFGIEVFVSFPSANNDISEAGTCLALERGTACVLHLMRVVEVGLKIFATAVGVGTQTDWGSYLREIDKTLEAKTKAAEKRSADEQFYAEVRVTIDGVRMAWRNPTMHIESNYSPERAEEILGSVKTLMRHLATRLSEQPSPLSEQPSP
jgi:hypothetical protein